MRALLLREMRMLLTSTSTWVVALAMILSPGFRFLINLDTTWEWSVGSLIEFLNFMLVLLVPALTMSTIAGEREKGTWTLLRSDPVTPGQIVMAKYFVLLLYYIGLVSLSVGTAIYFIRQAGGEFDAARELGLFVSHIMISSWYLAVGLASSAHARTQVSSFLLTFVCILAFSFLGRIGEQKMGLWGSLMALDTHISAFTYGLIRFKDIFYFSSGILLSLILAGRVISLEVKSRLPILWRLLPIPLWVMVWVYLQAHMVNVEKTWDYSRMAITKPSEEALIRVKNVSNGTKIISVWSSHDELVSMVEAYLQNMQLNLPGLEVQHYRLERDEEEITHFLQNYQVPQKAIQSPGGLILLRGDQRSWLGANELVKTQQSPGSKPFKRWRGEIGLVKEMLALSRKKLGKIAVLKAANSEPANAQTQINIKPLRLMGFEVDTDVLPEKLDAKTYPLTYFFNPRDTWSPELIAQLKKYRESGGKLAVMVEPTSKLENPRIVKGLLKEGLNPRVPGVIAGTLPEHLKKSYGDATLVFKEPFFFNGRNTKVFFRDRRSGEALSVTYPDGLTVVGDVDWLREPLWELSSENPRAFQLFTEFLLGQDEHHYVRKVNLDVQIQAMTNEARKELEFWLLKMLPAIVMAVGLLLVFIRRRKSGLKLIDSQGVDFLESLRGRASLEFFVGLFCCLVFLSLLPDHTVPEQKLAPRLLKMQPAAITQCEVKWGEWSGQWNSANGRWIEEGRDEEAKVYGLLHELSTLTHLQALPSEHGEKAKVMGHIRWSGHHQGEILLGPKMLGGNLMVKIKGQWFLGNGEILRRIEALQKK